MSQKKSRRQFLKGLATLGAGVALAGCQQVVTVEKKVIETVEVEKVVEKEVVKTVVIEKEVEKTVIVEKEIEKVGDHRPITIDVRIIAATNKDLVKLMEDGSFREDLYYRIGVIPIYLPPMRERDEDIPLLTETFINRARLKTDKPISGMSREALDLLIAHDWPGNVRELENVIEYAFVLCHDQQIDVRHLPEDFQNLIPQPAESLPSQDLSRLKRAEADAIQAALRRNKYDMGRTARDLKVSRTTLWRKMKRYHIETPHK